MNESTDTTAAALASEADDDSDELGDSANKRGCGGVNLDPTE
jgi:hypothetical protein